MDYVYKITTDNVKDEEGKSRTVYGIECSTDDDPSQRIKRVPDIFTDKKRAEKFAENCNLHKLSPIHLYDVIEDIIS